MVDYYWQMNLVVWKIPLFIAGLPVYLLKLVIFSVQGYVLTKGQKLDRPLHR